MNRFLVLMGCALTLHPAVAQKTVAPPSNPAHDLARSLSSAFADVYDHIAPGVVVIEAQPDRSARARYPVAGPMSQFFPSMPDADPNSGGTNQGSGFVITADGYILTNNHVLEEEGASKVRVTLKDGRKFDAQVVGVDPITDLAVLKIKAAGLPVVELGDSDKTRVGEFAFALGAPFDLRDTFTYGIVSAKGRTDITRSQDYEEFIQTDASINPGNSGGPLVNIDGQVIGVNTLIRDLNRGLGFAIPINIAKKVAAQLIADGRAVRPWLGIMIESMDNLPELAQRFPDLPRGILVNGIQAGTPAATSDLRVNDIITKVDGTSVATARELQKAILDKKIGDEIELQVWRSRGGLVKVKLRTAERTSGYLPVANQRPLSMDDEDAAPSIAPRSVPKVAPAPSSTGGLVVRTLTADAALAMKLQADEGVLVTSVQPGSAAAAAGVQVGDVITSVGSTAVSTKEDFLKALQGSDGDAVMLNLNRGDEKTYGILKF